MSLRTVAAIGAVIVLGKSPALAQCGNCDNASFGRAPTDFALAGQPNSLVAGDFDGDGGLDIIVGNVQNGVAFLRGLPGGRFASPVYLTTSLNNPTAIRTADMDQDGNLDLIVLDAQGVEILYGSGDGAFPTQQNVPAGSFSSSLEVGDLNGDGLPDLIGGSGGGVTTVLNNGDRSFSAPKSYGNGQFGPIALGDFNGDKKLDVALGTQVFLGVGDGTLQSPLPPVATIVWSSAVADFNNDGMLDIAFADYGNLYVLYGHGDGTFASPVTIAPVTFATWMRDYVSIADFNGDGWPDLVVASYPTNLSVVLSDGSGGFQVPTSYPLGLSPVTILTLDADRDGHPDVVVANDYPTSVTLFRGNPDGSLERGLRLPVSAAALAAADLNGDSKQDLIAGGIGLTVWIGDGAGNFAAGYSNPAPSYVVGIETTDVNHDGHIDIVALARTPDFLPHQGDLWVFLGDGLGGFSSLSPMHLDFAPDALALAKLDSDDFPDLVITGIAYDPAPGIHVYRGVGDGTFAPTFNLGSGSYSQIVLRDFNNDGKLDLAALHGNLSLFLGDGLGGFQAPAEYVANGGSMAVGDFNGDGKVDIVTNGNLSFLRGKGDGTFEPALWFRTAPSGLFITALDFDGDGKLDVALSGDSELLLRGNSDGTFALTGRYFNADTNGQTIVADWNSDGKPDLAIATAGEVLVLFNTNCKAERLDVATQPSTCAAPAGALTTQPSVSVMDDGGNLVSCATDPVAAALVPGTGSPGAVLGGITTQPLQAGVAMFTDLSIDRAGADYVLEFHSTGLIPVRSRPVSVHAAYGVSISGPSSFCPGTVASFSGDIGFDTYVWSIDGHRAGTGRFLSVSGLSDGPHTLALDVEKAGCAASTSRSISVGPTPPPVASNNGPVCPTQTLQLSASAIPGATYLWTGPNGFTSTQQNPQIPSPSLAVSGIYQVVATVVGCPSLPASTTVVVQTACPLHFFLVTPCRAIDTRAKDSPPLSASKKRTFVLANRCGIPSSAKAVSVNITVTSPTTSGYLTAFPGGTSAPATATISYRAGQTRANDAALLLGDKADLAVRCTQPTGTVQLIVDVNGFFQ